MGHPGAKWDPADYLPRVSAQTKADIERLVPLIRTYMRRRKVPMWLLAKVDDGVAMAWFAVEMRAVEMYRLPERLFGIVSAVRIYTGRVSP